MGKSEGADPSHLSPLLLRQRRVGGSKGPGESIRVSVSTSCAVLDDIVVLLEFEAPPCETGVIILDTVEPLQRAMVRLHREAPTKEIDLKCLHSEFDSEALFLDRGVALLPW